MNFIDTRLEYSRDRKLKKEDVNALVEWVHRQAHLSDINELQAIFFLKKSHYKLEPAKTTVDSYLTAKKLWPEMFVQRSYSHPTFKGAYDVMLISPLPQRTPQDHTVIFVKALSPDMVKYDVQILMKYYDMVSMLDLYQNGSSQGQIMLLDMQDYPLSYLPKLKFKELKRFFYYMQELMPIKQLAALHFINSPPFMSNFLSIVEPTLPQTLLSSVFVHESLSDLSKHIPLELLPEEYGGSAPSRKVLQENIKRGLQQNDAFFEWEESQTSDESGRSSKNRTAEEIFGFENGNGVHV